MVPMSRWTASSERYSLQCIISVPREQLSAEHAHAASRALNRHHCLELACQSPIDAA